MYFVDKHCDPIIVCLQTMDFSRNIRPLFIKHGDVKRSVEPKLLPISLCREIEKLIPKGLIGLQQYYGIWRIYTSTTAARSKLFTSLLKFMNKEIAVYDSNPFLNKKNKLLADMNVY